MTERYEATVHCERCFRTAQRLTELTTPGPDWCPHCRSHDPDGYEAVILARRPDIAAGRQADDAIALLNRNPSDFLRWPFRDFGLYPAMTPGSVNVFAAGSGIGKTTAMLSMIRRWVAAGVGCYVLPLESQPRTFRVGMLCHALGIHAGQALTGELRRRELEGDATAKAQRDQLKAALRALPNDSQVMDNLYVGSERAITARKLAAAAAHARMLGMQVLIVDHVDHVGDDDERSGNNAIAESKRVLHTALDAALKYDLQVLLTSQLNSSGSRVDRLARFAPPQLEHLLLHTYKVQVAEQIWAGYRPLDPRATPGDLTDARNGRMESWRVLWPGRSGFVNLKMRHDPGTGVHEGGRVILAYDNGVLRERTGTEEAQDEIRSAKRDDPPHPNPDF